MPNTYKQAVKMPYFLITIHVVVKQQQACAAALQPRFAASRSPPAAGPTAPGSAHGTIDNGRPDELAALQSLGKQAQASAVVIQDLQVIRSFTAEEEQVARERITIHHPLGLRRQAIETIAHADRMTGQIDFGAGGDLDHDVTFNTARTRRKARSLTKASTRKRTPSARSISITPGRSSRPGRGSVAQRDDAPPATAEDDPTASADAPSSAEPNTPIGMNAQACVAPGCASAAACPAEALTAAVAAEDDARAALRQLNSRFAFTP